VPYEDGATFATSSAQEHDLCPVHSTEAVFIVITTKILQVKKEKTHEKTIIFNNRDFIVHQYFIGGVPAERRDGDGSGNRFG
jgi:hypothetical protein